MLVEIVDWQINQENLKSIRLNVFVSEQNVPEHLELDKLDATAIHALAMDDGVPIVTGRLLPDGHLGRVAALF